MKKRILVLEDDKLVIETLRNALGFHGYYVVGYQGGFDAIKAFKTGNFDLIVCDICMPGEDDAHLNQNGIQVIKEIRDIERKANLPPIPVIMISGYGDAIPAAPINAIKVGVEDYFPKPFDNDELIKSIELHLGKSTSISERHDLTAKTTQFNVLGTGIVGPFGFTKEAFWEYINKCSPAWDKLEGAAFPELNGHYCTKIKGFSADKYFDEKQLHNVDDNSAFMAVAAKFALEDSSIKVSKIGSDEIGVSMGTSISIATAMSDFDESVLRDGSRRSKIGIFPNTVICSAASRVSIFEHITGSNTTISTSMNSGIDAIGHACFCLQSGMSKVMIAGGSDALSEKILLGYLNEKLLFNDSSAIRRNKRGAFVPSEGACVLVLKKVDREHSESQVYCEILSYACGFAPFKKRDTVKSVEVVYTTLQDCLNDAGLTVDDINCFILGNYFDELNYEVEVRAIGRLLRKYRHDIPILAPKKILGESFAAFAPELIILAVGLFNRRISPEAIHYLNENKSDSAIERIRNALIVQVDSSGHHSAVILKSIES